MSEIIVQRMTPAMGIPTAASLRSWAVAARGKRRGNITLRIVGQSESQTLNKQYRGKDKPTNVLSFGYGENNVLGDLIICAPVVALEAKEQGKQPRAHWAHMIVHGCLHLLGHDHENDQDAKRMEAREVKILKELGFNNPYTE